MCKKFYFWVCYTIFCLFIVLWGCLFGLVDSNEISVLGLAWAVPAFALVSLYVQDTWREAYCEEDNQEKKIVKVKFRKFCGDCEIPHGNSVCYHCTPSGYLEKEED